MKTTILIFPLILLFLCNFVFAKNITGKPRIIDGDTIHIKNNKIRLHGIDAPETKQTCKLDNEKWYCGKHSTEELKKLIYNQEIKCETKDIDIYNRYVAICFVNKININQWMVKNGWAIAYRYYSTDYIREEKYARDNKLGVWKSKFMKPYAFRQLNKK